MSSLVTGGAFLPPPMAREMPPVIFTSVQAMGKIST